MGFFVKDDARSPLLGAATPLPIDSPRVQAAMERLGWSCVLDDDGDILSAFEGGFYYMLFFGPEGEFFQVRARWRGVLDAAHAAEAHAFCADWNRTRLWPKAYADVVEDEVYIVGEYAVDYSQGVTDDQIAAHLQCAINTEEMLFEACAEQFPAFAPADEE